MHWTFFYYLLCGTPLCFPASRHNRDDFDHHMRLDPVALGNMKRVRTEKTRPNAAPPLSINPFRLH
jgi:hypothetical protein